MGNSGWKKVERFAADLIGGRRYWANAGEKVDVESHEYVGQVKNLAKLSQYEIKRLAVEIEREARDRSGPLLRKIGIVVFRPSGSKRTIVAMTAEEFARLRLLAEKPMI